LLKKKHVKRVISEIEVTEHEVLPLKSGSPPLNSGMIPVKSGSSPLKSFCAGADPRGW